MALTVGTDTYISLADAETWATEHLLGSPKTAWDAASDPEKEAALRNATEFIDRTFDGRWVGVSKADSDQVRTWPRNFVVDNLGRSVEPDTIPAAVEDTTARLAADLVTEMPDDAKDRGGAIKREKVGELEVEYMDGARSGKSYPYLRRMLNHLLRPGANRVVRV